MIPRDPVELIGDLPARFPMVQVRHGGLKQRPYFPISFRQLSVRRHPGPTIQRYALCQDQPCQGMKEESQLWSHCVRKHSPGPDSTQALLAREV